MCNEVAHNTMTHHMHHVLISTHSLTFDVRAQDPVPIHLSEVQCDGTETSLLSCAHTSDPPSTCTHFTDAFIVCRTGDPPRVTPSLMSLPPSLTHHIPLSHWFLSLHIPLRSSPPPPPPPPYFSSFISVTWYMYVTFLSQV